MNVKQKILSKSYVLYYSILFLIQTKDFFKRIFIRNIKLANSKTSKLTYDKYGNREILDYEKNQSIALLNNKLILMNFKKIRNQYLKYIFNEINKILKEKKEVNILEIGCGNGINSMLLKEHFKDKINIDASDISMNRINEGKKFYGKRMKDINFFTLNIVDNKLDNNKYDIVFSIHVLEQLPYETKSAIKNMYSMSNNKVILIEPDWYLSNPLQRLYLINSDHTRVITDSINILGYKLIKNEKYFIQGCIYNPSILFVLSKLENENK